MPLWRPAAIADRQRIIDFIAQDSPLAAVRMGDLFMEKALMLDRHPKLGRPGRIAGTRELVVHENYILIYRVVGVLPEVLRIKHAAQQWP